jgi:apoptosis-inducing factor 2
MSSLHATIVGSVISALRFILQVLDVSIQALYSMQEKLLPPSSSVQGPVQTVVIVGGNFAGLAALGELLSNRNKSNLQIILIDQRAYSEYTPGILRLFCEPELFHQVAQPLPTSQQYKNFQFIQGRVTSLVDSDSTKGNQKILTYTPTGETGSSNSPQTLKYDHVIVATGATYTAPISPTPQELTLPDRFHAWQAAHDDLQKAKTIIVLGGGAVGVELAAEIVDYFPNKKVTLLDAQPSLVPLFPKTVSDYAQRWLEQRGVTLKLGQPLQSWTDKTCTLQDGTMLKADMVYVCFGNKPNSEVAQQQQLCSLTDRKFIAVKDTLQVVSALNNDDDDSSAGVLSSILVCGDVASPPTNDQKQALQAEIQGKLAACNVLQLASSTNNTIKKNLLRYPDDFAGSSQMPLIFVLSLGRYDGVLGFNALVIPGPLAAIVKWILEYTKVLDMKGSLLGHLIWKLADAVVLFLSRTLIVPVQATSSSTPKQQKMLKKAA